MFGTTGLRRLSAGAVFFVALALAGCGGGSGDAGKGSKNSLSGTVTHKGQKVSGTVYFLDSAGKEHQSPLTGEGKYEILDIASGQAKIYVRGTGLPAGVKAPDMGGAPGGGVSPPAKYAQPNNGLTVNVTGGAQTHDIDLK